MEALLAEAVAWRRANYLRAYIAAVEERATGRGQPANATPELAEWLTWAREQADRLDPVSSTSGRLTGTNVAAKDDPRMG